MIESYSKIHNLGHPAITELLKGPVIVEEKVDGSQFSFSLGKDGELEMRSKGQQLNLLDPEKLFLKAVESISSIKDSLVESWIYRGEYLAAPHHNALTYTRIPKNHVVIFDINSKPEMFLEPKLKAFEAGRIGLECVPVLFQGVIEDEDQLKRLLEMPSMLGGQRIEGVVIKPVGYDLFGRDGKVLMGKYVSPAFREVHKGTWKTEHKTPSPNEIIEQLAQKYRTPARWAKAVMHFKEAGLLKTDLTDIGLLMREVPVDVLDECQEMIQFDLMRWAWPQLKRKVTQGLPEWYKAELTNAQFAQIKKEVTDGSPF